MFEDVLGETGGTVLQFALALVVVLLLIMLVAWLLKRFGGTRFGSTSAEQAELQVVTSLSIDPKRKLVLVRHGKLEHLLLIGGGSDEVVERSMIGGIPLAARVQAGRAQEKQPEDEPRAVDRFRTPTRFSTPLTRREAADTSNAAGKNAAKTETPDAASALSKATAGTLGTAPTAGAAATAAATGIAALSQASRGGTSASAAQTGAGVSTTATVSASSPNVPPVAKPATQPMVKLVAQDEREALNQSLDEALSRSLLDPEHQAEPAAPPVPAAPKAESAPRELKAPSGQGPSDADLEREIEAALELDAFDDLDADLPPLDLPSMDLPTTELAGGSSFPGLPDVADFAADEPVPASKPAVTDIVEAAKAASTQQQPSFSEPEDGTKGSVREAANESNSAKPDESDPVEPLESHEAAKEETDEAASPQERIEDRPATKSPPVRDIPIGLSGRTEPPIPVPIPSRGPAANAKTLAKAEASDAPVKAGSHIGDSVDISALLAPKLDPSPAQGETGTKPRSASDLDEEMRRLLGEIAGEPQTK